MGLGPGLVLKWTLSWPYNTPDTVLYILAIFLHSMQQKWDQGTLGTQRSTPLGLGPGLVLHWTLPWPHNTPDMVLYILATFLHSMQQKWDQWDSRDTKVEHHWVGDPSWSFNGYIFAFYEPKWGQGTLGKQRSTLIGSRTRLGLSRDPVLTLQYT